MYNFEKEGQGYEWNLLEDLKMCKFLKDLYICINCINNFILL